MEESEGRSGDPRPRKTKNRKPNQVGRLSQASSPLKCDLPGYNYSRFGLALTIG